MPQWVGPPRGKVQNDFVRSSSVHPICCPSRCTIGRSAHPAPPDVAQASNCVRRRPSRPCPAHKAVWSLPIPLIGPRLQVLRLASERQVRSCGCARWEEHTSELQSRLHLVCRLLLEKKKK